MGSAEDSNQEVGRAYEVDMGHIYQRLEKMENALRI